MIMPSRSPARIGPDRIGLLLSGGVDSAILLGHLVRQGRRVQPFYVTTGCRWEAEERQAVQALLQQTGGVAPLVTLQMPTEELYGQHWSITGCEVPAATTSDEAVALPGRNPLLLLKPMLWCGQQGISELALATLACNPFADATEPFFSRFEEALAIATGRHVRVVCPFAQQSKAEILRLASGLPLELTFSCLAPQQGLHCGDCNKCAERRRGLESLTNGDPTVYAAARLPQYSMTEKVIS